ncbi:type II secretion system protein [bacterium]|nr:type II secretion system protein [bacterium]
MSRKIHSKKAFTLIEVMVVVAIIGILASMGISSYTRALQNGRDARRKSDLDEVRKALQIYWAEHLGNAPASLDLASLTTNGYLDKNPTSVPLGGGETFSYAITSSTSGSQKFIVCVQLERKTGNYKVSGSTYTSCDPATASDCSHFCATN